MLDVLSKGGGGGGGGGKISTDVLFRLAYLYDIANLCDMFCPGWQICVRCIVHGCYNNRAPGWQICVRLQVCVRCFVQGGKSV